MNNLLRWFSIFTWLSMVVPGIAEAQVSNPSPHTTSDLRGGHTLNLQQAHNGHGGEEDLYFQKKRHNTGHG